MRVRPFRIPRHIVLPGVVVQVKLVGPREPDEDGCELGRGTGDFDYDPRTGKCVIRIKRTISIARQRLTLIHELQHLMTDYVHVALTYNRRWFKV